MRKPGSQNTAIRVTSPLRSQQKLFYCPVEATQQALLSDNGAGRLLLAGRTLSLCKSPSSGSVTVHQPNHQSVNLFFPLHQRGRERHCCVQSESRCSGERAGERVTHTHTEQLSIEVRQVYQAEALERTSRLCFCKGQSEA